MTSPDSALAALLQATRALVAATPDLRAFVGEGLESLDYTRPTPRALPVTDRLAMMPARAAPRTAALAQALSDAAPHLEWQQSYSEAQVGAHYLANYGWSNLVSPDGPYRTGAIRISVGYWEQGLIYPQHHHTPEEIYCVVAGGARFESAGRAPVQAGPGTLIPHAPSQMHGFAMQGQPLLAMAFWKGAGLTAISTLDTPS